MIVGRKLFCIEIEEVFYILWLIDELIFRFTAAGVFK
jgi:hypothetical protein